MTGYFTDSGGKAWRTPQILSWDISHGFCSPCDGFEISFLFSADMIKALREAVRFRAEQDGETVFCGVVDEFEATADEKGCTVCVRGRGLQALLLDNEAESADYFGAGLDYILQRHALPFGVSDVDKSGISAAKADMSVSSGESCWSVIARYAEFCCGAKPRFSPEGTLVLDGEKGGRTLEINSRTCIAAQSVRQDRYGVISEAVVKNKSAGTETVIKNDKFIGLGGACMRIISVPKKTGFDAMKYTGSYQIKKSMEDFFTVCVTLPGGFRAFPGDKVHMTASPLGVSGEYMVRQLRCRADGKGCRTELELAEI